jgi:hypothetical protein
MNDDVGTMKIAPPPRALTPRARRRSWGEMPVRVWMVASIVVMGATAYLTIERVHQALADRWLIQHGTAVTARFERVAGDPVPKRRPRNESMWCDIKFTLGGTEYSHPILLEAKPGAFARVGDDFPIRVDPRNPKNFTYQTEVKPWVQELTIVGILAPLALVLVMVTWLRRRSVLNVWRRGNEAQAIVVDVRHTAVAPLSRVIRFILNDTDDGRVWSTLMPTSAGIPEKGQALGLIHPPGNPGRAIVAKLYQPQ